MNVNQYNKKKYENFIPPAGYKNKPNSNPNKANFRKAKMNINSLITKDCRKNDDFIVRINKPNLRNGQNERKLNFNKGLQKKRFFAAQKTNPNKPNFKQAFFAAKIGNFFPKNSAVVRKRQGNITYLEIFFNLLNGELAFEGYYKRLFFHESCREFAENKGKNVKFGKSVTFGITGGTYM